MFKLRRLLPIAYAVALFFFVFGAKCWVVDRFGSDIPNWDQWDAEATNLLLPYYKNELEFRDLFKPHNEHRIFLTKTLNLGLVVLGGQWDARAQCVANAFLHSALAAAVFYAGRRLLKPVWHAPFFVSCALFFGLPISWQNLLGGLHSAQSFLLWFSLASIWLFSFSKNFSRGWWIGFLAAIAANFSLGSGFLSAGSVMFVLGVRVLRRHQNWKEVLPTLAACGIAVVIGGLMRVPFPAHDFLKAHSFREFSLTFLHCVRWPNCGTPEHRPHDFRPWIVYITYLPLLVFAWHSLRQKTSSLLSQNVILATGVWLLFQFGATAYARGANASWPASRYLDTLALGLLLNGMALAMVFDHLRGAANKRILVGILVIGLTWIGVVGIGLWQQTRLVLQVDLPNEKARLVESEINVRDYLATGDYECLNGHVIPYPSAAELAERLSHPEIRALMPASIRTPVRIDAVTTPTSSVFAAETGRPVSAPVLKYAKTWSSHPAASEGVWRSKVFTPAFSGRLKVELAGNVGDSGLSVFIVDGQTGEELGEALTKRAPRAAWHPVYLPMPLRPIQIVAVDERSNDWLAFSEPVEMSNVSFFTLRLVKQGWLIFFFSMAVITLFATAHWMFLPRTISRQQS